MSIKRLTAAVLAPLIAGLVLAAQGSAYASSVKIPAIGVNAPIVKVPVRHSSLAIGENTQVAYTWSQGDPPCDPTGNTVYVLHAWRAGNGVGDHLAALHRGNHIMVNGCHFKVTKVRIRSGKLSIGQFSRVDGPPGITLISCKADNYTMRVFVRARLITKGPLKGPASHR